MMDVETKSMVVNDDIRNDPEIMLGLKKFFKDMYLFNKNRDSRARIESCLMKPESCYILSSYLSTEYLSMEKQVQLFSQRVTTPTTSGRYQTLKEAFEHHFYPHHQKDGKSVDTTICGPHKLVPWLAHHLKIDEKKLRRGTIV